MSASATSTAANCGVNNGTVNLTVTGGVAPFTYAWSNSAATEDLSGLAAGTYNVTVTDAINATATASVKVALLSATNTTTGVSYATIQAAITAATSGDVINVCAGTFTENLTVNKRITLNGAGATTIITSAAASTPVITITASGSNATDRLVVSNLKVTGATGSENSGAGILLQSATATGYFTFSGVEASGNQGSGIAFNNTANVTDVKIINNCSLSNNGFGLRIASPVPSFDGLTVTDCQMNNNTYCAFAYNQSGTLSSVGTNFNFTNCSFSDNNKAGFANQHDLSFYGFHGNASLTNVTVTCSNGPATTHKGYGILFSNASAYAAAGTIALNGVTVSGVVGKSALSFQYYNDMSNVSLTNVDISGCTAPWGQLTVDQSGSGTFNTGNTTLKTLGVWNSANIDATSAIFKDYTTGTILNRSTLSDCFQIENQVVHKLDNAAFGLVRVKAANIYVTSTSGSIQRGVDAASVSDVITVDTGTYAEELWINKPLTLRGPNASISGNGSRVAEAVLQFPLSSVASGDALIYVGDAANAVMSGVTIEGFDLRCQDATIPKYLNVIYAYRNNNLTIRNNRLYSSEVPIYLRTNGFGDYCTGLLVEGNYVDCGPNVNNQYNRGIYVEATSGTIQDNQFLNANIGIQYMPYAHATAGLIRRNTVTASLTGLYHNYQTKGAASVTWEQNVVSAAPNPQTGLSAQVDGARTTPTTFRGIHVITFGTQGTGDNPSVTFQNNSINAANPGGTTSTAFRAVYLSATSAGNVTLSKNSFTNYTEGIVRDTDATTTTITATCNWWGSVAASTVATAASSATTYIPYLTRGDDSETNTPGFQTTEACSACNEKLSVTNVAICSSELPFTWNGRSITSAGTYTNLTPLTGTAGCDSTATVVLTVKSLTSSSTSVSICTPDLPYSWNGSSFSAAGTYLVHLTNAVGCDSAATLVLTVNAPSSSSFDSTICTSALPFTWMGHNFTAAGSYTLHTTNAAGCDSAITLNVTTTVCNSYAHITLFIEGLYAGGSSMNTLLANASVGSSMTDVDTVTVVIYDSVSMTDQASAKGVLQADGTLDVTLPPLSGNYHIGIRHPGTLETWSTNAQTFTSGGTTTYYFTTSVSQALGDNMTEIEPGVFAMYSGDIDDGTSDGTTYTQDGVIDGSDFLIMDTNIQQNLYGYYPTDITGDGVTDGSDFLIYDTNAQYNRGVFHP